MRGALKRLSRIGVEARKAAGAAEAALEQAFAQAEEARRELDALLSRLGTDSGELERKEERLFAIRAVARKFAVPPTTCRRAGGIPFEARSARSRRRKFKEAEGRRGGGARLLICDTAERLSAARKSAAQRSRSRGGGRTDAAQARPCQIPRCAAAQDEPAGKALERVAFEVATIEGAAFGALAKIASGGELARFSLPLKVSLAQSGPPVALVFDEVDRGVGGAVADAVGVRLQRLAQSTQVLARHPFPASRRARRAPFPHHPQGRQEAVELLNDEARLEEVARMLSGAAVTDEARAAAARLIAEAQAAQEGAQTRMRRLSRLSSPLGGGWSEGPGGGQSDIFAPLPALRATSPSRGKEIIWRAMSKSQPHPEKLDAPKQRRNSTPGARDRRTRPRVLSRRDAPQYQRCRLRRAAPAQCRDRGAFCRADAPGQSVASRRRQAIGEIRQGDASRGDALARQRLCRPGRHRFCGARSPLSWHEGRRRPRLHRRTEDRRAVGIAAL